MMLNTPSKVTIPEFIKLQTKNSGVRSQQVPILAITGEKDVQVDPEGIGRLKSLDKENIQGTVIKNMDHILKEFRGDKTVINLMKQYKKEASQPTHPMLKEVLAGWLQQFRCSNIRSD